MPDQTIPVRDNLPPDEERLIEIFEDMPCDLSVDELIEEDPDFLPDSPASS